MAKQAATRVMSQGDTFPHESPRRQSKAIQTEGWHRRRGDSCICVQADDFASVTGQGPLSCISSTAVAVEDLERLLDIKIAFLHVDLTEEIYMEQPEGYEQGEAKVCRQRRARYGLKQAPRAWWLQLVKQLGSWGSR